MSYDVILWLQLELWKDNKMQVLFAFQTLALRHEQDRPRHEGKNPTQHLDFLPSANVMEQKPFTESMSMDILAREPPKQPCCCGLTLSQTAVQAAACNLHYFHQKNPPFGSFPRPTPKAQRGSLPRGRWTASDQWPDALQVWAWLYREVTLEALGGSWKRNSAA